MIGWLLRRLQKRHPGAVLVASLVILLGGVAVLIWWVSRDLSQGRLLRPAIAVLVLAGLAMRVIVTFNPYRR